MLVRLHNTKDAVHMHKKLDKIIKSTRNVTIVKIVGAA
jgi:hypothetical protein